jgi:hypothetical protein
MRISDKLGPIRLADSTGRETPLGSYWCDRTVVLVFIRHFG